jgi:ketosteroid isomerase-like protein
MSADELVIREAAPAAAPPSPPRQAMRELVSMFADALCAGDRERIDSLVSADALYQVPGRSSVAGIHDGRDTVVSVLCTEAPAGTTIDRVEVTELLVDGERGLLVIAVRGHGRHGPFDYETALHLHTNGEQVIAITEYSGDQYAADAALDASIDAPPAATPPAGKASTRSRTRRWWRRA